MAKRTLTVVILALMLLSGCQSETITPTIPVPTTRPELDMTTETTELPSETSSPQPTSTPDIPLRKLTICIPADAGVDFETTSSYPSLFPLLPATDLTRVILPALYDGPLEVRNFSYHPTLFDHLPSIENGEAVLQSVPVSLGDRVLDASGNVITLALGSRIFPTGCSDISCSSLYDGTASFEMDQLSVTFKMLAGLQWDDGQSLTAADSFFAYQAASNTRDVTLQQRVNETAAYQVVDDTTVVWRGVPGLLARDYPTRFFFPLPEHLWGSIPLADLPNAPVTHTPPGWGAYKIVGWEPANGPSNGPRLVLERNSYYHKTSLIYPAFDQLIYLLVELPSSTPEDAILAAIQNSTCDIFAALPQVDNPKVIFKAAAEGSVQAATIPNNEIEFLHLGIVPASYDDGRDFAERPDFFSDPQTRQAMAYCINRPRLVQEIYGVTDAELWNELIPPVYTPPSHWLLPPEVPQYVYNPDLGKELLDASGWIQSSDVDTPRIYQGDNPGIPRGTAFSVQLWTSLAGQRQESVSLIAEDLADCGISVSLDAFPLQTLLQAGPESLLFGRRFDLAQFSWAMGLEPACQLWHGEYIPGGDVAKFPYRWAGWNLSGYNNPDFDEACAEAMGLLIGQPAYNAAHQLAFQIFASDLPAIPLYTHLSLVVARPDLCNFAAGPDGGLLDIGLYDYGNCENQP